jgi:hypothetical protein
MDSDQDIQLLLIHEVTTCLHAAHIPHWLFGGWAIDFHLGSITRQHDDIEFLMWRTDEQAIATTLLAHEYERYQGGFVDEMAIFFKQGQKVEFDLLTHTATNEVVVDGRWADLSWPAGAFAAPAATFAGITCPIVSAQALLWLKQRYASHPAGGSLRPKDRADIQRLQDYLQQR